MRFSCFRPLALSVLLAAPMAAAAQPSDTTKVSIEPLFTKRDAMIAGGFVVATIAMYPVDRYMARRLQNPSTQENRFLSDAASGFRWMGTPGSVIIGTSLYTVGRVGGNERMADLGLHGTEALFVAIGAVSVIKGLAGRGRPLLDIGDPGNFGFARGYRKDSDNYRSFPSGHTAMGFAAASAVTAETSQWWPKSTKFVAPLMYGGATMIGLSRMYNNKHWTSDVVMGAAIGTFAGLKVVKYHHSHPNNRIDRILLGARVIPDGNGGAVVAMTIFTR